MSLPLPSLPTSLPSISVPSSLVPLSVLAHVPALPSLPPGVGQGTAVVVSLLAGQRVRAQRG